MVAECPEGIGGAVEREQRCRIVGSAILLLPFSGSIPQECEGPGGFPERGPIRDGLLLGVDAPVARVGGPALAKSVPAAATSFDVAHLDAPPIGPEVRQREHGKAFGLDPELQADDDEGGDLHDRPVPWVSTIVGSVQYGRAGGDDALRFGERIGRVGLRIVDPLAGKEVLVTPTRTQYRRVLEIQLS